METSQYDLCLEVLRRLAKNGLLKNMVLVGSWCSLFYEKYFSEGSYKSSIKTRDIDFLIPEPSRIKQVVDIPDLLKDLGFVTGFTGSQGYIRLEHPQLIVEFLVPEKGRGSSRPYRLEKLGINAQALRFLDFLCMNAVTIEAEGLILNLPHPANFVLHKLLILKKRPRDKRLKDIQAAEKILKALVENGQSDSLKKTLGSIPRRWRTKIASASNELSDKNLLAFLF